MLHGLKRTTRHSAVKCENAVKLNLKHRPTASNVNNSLPLSYYRLEQPTDGTSRKLIAWKSDRKISRQELNHNKTWLLRLSSRASFELGNQLPSLAIMAVSRKVWESKFFTIVFQSLTFVVSFSIFSRYPQSQQLLLVTPRRRLCSKRVWLRCCKKYKIWSRFEYISKLINSLF